MQHGLPARIIIVQLRRNECLLRGVSVCARVCVRVYVRVYVRVCVCACVRVCVGAWVRAWRYCSCALQVLIGYNSGEVVLRELYSKKLTWYRLGKQPAVSSPVTALKWVPGTDLFLVAHDDGMVYVHEKDRKQTHEIKRNSSGNAAAVSAGLSVTKGKHSANPVAEWDFNTQKAVYDISFSPDTQHVAFVGKEGMLRVCNFEQETEVFCGKSYFGALHCVAWSPSITNYKSKWRNIWILSDPSTFGTFGAGRPDQNTSGI